MSSLNLKPTHKAVSAYYGSLAKFEKLGIKYETAVRSAFHELLEHCARQFDWKLVPEYAIKRKGQADAKADGALLDNYCLNHGLWEAKDSADDLNKEIKYKFSIGYPKQNILFWQPDRAVLYQNGERYYEADLTKSDDLVRVLTLFLEFAPPAIAEWEKAVEEFKNKVPQIAPISQMKRSKRNGLVGARGRVRVRPGITHRFVFGEGAEHGTLACPGGASPARTCAHAVTKLCGGKVGGRFRR